MSWSSAARRAFIVALLLPLAACGFHPLYGDQPAFSYDPNLAAIKIAPIRDHIGQIVETSLREQLNPRGADVKTRYLLKVVLSVARADLGIERNATSLRSRITLDASYSLSETGAAHPLHEGKSAAVTSFNFTNDAYAATVAEESARRQAAEDVSRDIAVQVALWLRGQHPG
jgi:LPS-assembly lipoprotein